MHQNVTGHGEIIGDYYLQILQVYFDQRKYQHNSKTTENSFCKKGKKLPMPSCMSTPQPFLVYILFDLLTLSIWLC